MKTFSNEKNTDKTKNKNNFNLIGHSKEQQMATGFFAIQIRKKNIYYDKSF